MTNIISSFVVSLLVVTNWTGSIHEGKELGFVQTNHVLTAIYKGTTKHQQLKTDLSNIAVWREPEHEFKVYWNTNLFYTNVLWPRMSTGTTMLLPMIEKP